MNVLIVEDERSLANEIAFFLKSENFLCDLAFTGSQASEKIAVNLYDFVLLDLGLPDYQGLDLIREAKKAAARLHLLLLRQGVQSKIK